MNKIKDLNINGKTVKNMGSSSQLVSTRCPKCGKKMEHYLMSHDLYTIYTLITCPKHRFVAWEDVFDKPEINTSQNWTNCDKRFKH